jgi:hypothetical protein
MRRKPAETAAIGATAICEGSPDLGRVAGRIGPFLRERLLIG